MAVKLPKWVPPVTTDGKVRLEGPNGKTIEIKVNPPTAAKLSQQIAAQEKLALQTASS